MSNYNSTKPARMTGFWLRRSYTISAIESSL